MSPESSTAYWNRVHEREPIKAADSTDPVCQRALEFFGDIRGKRLLELGFGNGARALFFASLGADVTAVDTSAVAVERLERYCQDQGIGNLRAIQQSVFDLPAGGPYDLVFGTMVLHHIEPFGEFVPVLRAAVTPQGRVFFCENNAAVGAIALWCRRHVAGHLWVPKFSDPDESPFSPEERRQLDSGFMVEVRYPGLVYFQLLSLYLFRNRLLPRIFTALDRLCYAVPALRRRSYTQFLYLTAR